MPQGRPSSGQLEAQREDDVTAERHRALLLLRSRQFVAAAEALGRLRQLNAGNPRSVVDAFLKGGSLGPGDGRAAPGEVALPSLAEELELGSELAQNQEGDLAGVVLKSAAGSFPDSAQAHGEYGILLSSRSQYQAALPDLEKAVDLDPASFKYSLALAEAQLSSKHNFTALKFLLAVRSRFDSLDKYQYILALAYYDCYKYPEAIAEFEAVARAEPQMDRVPFLIGNCYMALGELGKAEDYYRRAIALKPGEPSYRAALGKMLRMQGQIDEAIQVLEEELRLAPEDAESRYHLALCYEARNNFAQARRLLEQVVAQKPDMLSAHVALARVYHHEANREKAEREEKIISRLRARPQAEISKGATEAPSGVPRD